MSAVSCLPVRHHCLDGIRLCLVTPEYPPVPGGVGVSCSRVAAAVVAVGAQVTVVTRERVPGGMGEVRMDCVNGVEVHRIAHAAPFSSEAAFAVRQLVATLDREAPFHAFQGFFLDEAYACLQAAGRDPRRPVIASIHGDDVRARLTHPLWRGLILSVLRRARWVTSPSQEYLDRAHAEVSLTGRSSVIRNAAVAPDGATATWSLDESRRGVVGTVGEFRPVKDIPLLVGGYSRVLPEHRRGLVLAGYFVSSDDEAAVLAEAERRGVRRDMRLTGRLSRAEVNEWLGKLHVYVQSSAHEALPNALLEAAARGIPLVATAVGGMREVIEDGVHGLLVPQGDEAALGRAIERILSDEELAIRLSAGAFQLADTLSPEREAVAWTALYAGLLGKA
jgi:glycosyltransferase involved in cell wall biosynthesis